MSFLNELKKLNNTLIERLDWSEYFMSIALLASTRSPCTRLKVGCVLVKDNIILSTGYNGFLPGNLHNSIIVDNHEQATVHAEQNAISQAAKNGISINNSQAYITHYPCINCFKSLASAGITEIFYLDDYKNNPIISNLNQFNKIGLSQLKISSKIYNTDQNNNSKVLKIPIKCNCNEYDGNEYVINNKSKSDYSNNYVCGSPLRDISPINKKYNSDNDENYNKSLFEFDEQLSSSLPNYIKSKPIPIKSWSQ